MRAQGLPRPLVGREGEETSQSEDEVTELQQMELYNMDLQAQVIQQSGALSGYPLEFLKREQNRP